MPLVELENIRLYYDEHGHGPAQVLADGSAAVGPDPKVGRPQRGGAMSSHPAEYVPGHGAREIDRLIRQAEMVEPITRRFFVEAGIAPGMCVLDIGSGVGDVAFLAADLVGEAGHVTGIDQSNSALAMARTRSEARGLGNVRF